MKHWQRTAAGLEIDLGPTSPRQPLWMQFLLMCGAGLIGAAMVDAVHIWGRAWEVAVVLGATAGAALVGVRLFNAVVHATVKLEGATVLVDVQRLFRSRFRLARSQIRAVRLVGTTLELVCVDGVVYLPLAHRSDQTRQEVLALLLRFVEGGELDTADQVPASLVGLMDTAGG